MIAGPTAVGIFSNQEKTWSFNGDSFVGELQGLYDEISSEMNSMYGGTLSFLRIEYDAIEESYVLVMRTSNRFEGYLNLDVTLNEENSTMAIACDGAKGDGNGLAFYNDLSSIKDLIAFMTSSTFNVSANSVLAPTVLTLTAQGGTDALVLNLE